MDKIKTKKCPHCDKVITSLYQKQLESNYEIHLRNCKEKPKDERAT